MKEYRNIWTVAGIPVHVNVKADNAQEGVEKAAALAVSRGWEEGILDFDRIEELSDVDPKAPESSEISTVPTVHMNGTSRGELLEQLTNAHSGCREAAQGLRGAWPNARDYYVQGPEAYKRVVQEWESRIERINSVSKELEALAIAIDQAGSGRKMIDTENRVGYEFESEIFAEFGEVPIDDLVASLRRAAAAAITEKRRIEKIAREKGSSLPYVILAAKRDIGEVLSALDRVLVANEELVRKRLDSGLSVGVK